MNNFNSIPPAILDIYKRTVDAKIYHNDFSRIFDSLETKKYSLIAKDEIIKNYWKEFNLRNSDEDINNNSTKNELKKFNHSSYINKNFKLVISRRDIEGKHGDLYVWVSQKAIIDNNYFVLIRFNIFSESSHLKGEMLINFDLNGNPLRIIVTQKVL